MKKSKIAAVSEEIPKRALERLFEYAERVVLLGADPRLAPPVACHADMIFACVGDCLFFHESYMEAHGETVEEIVRHTGFKAVVTKEERGEKYPLDVALNVLPLKDTLVCKKSSTSPAVLSLCEEKNISITDVKQGYAACSVLCGDGFLITADFSIYNAVKDMCDALLIPCGNIRLEPYDTGFIGGATGYFGSTVFSVGEISLHPFGAEIISFLADRGIEVVSLCDGELSDVGGIKFFE